MISNEISLTTDNPQRLHNALDAAQPLLHAIDLAQLLRHGAVRTKRGRIVVRVVVAT
jgi:hypothetical protein